MISDRGEQTTSSLIITHATAKDSGQYQCDPSASYPQHVNVHVINTGQDGFEQKKYSILLISFQEDQVMLFGGLVLFLSLATQDAPYIS